MKKDNAWAPDVACRGRGLKAIVPNIALDSSDNFGEGIIDDPFEFRRLGPI